MRCGQMTDDSDADFGRIKWRTRLSVGGFRSAADAALLNSRTPHLEKLQQDVTRANYSLNRTLNQTPEITANESIFTVASLTPKTSRT